MNSKFWITWFSGCVVTGAVITTALSVISMAFIVVSILYGVDYIILTICSAVLGVVFGITTRQMARMRRSWINLSEIINIAEGNTNEI